MGFARLLQQLQIIPPIGKCLDNFKQENNPLKLHFDDNNYLETTASNVKNILTFFIMRMLEDKTKCISECHEEAPNDLKEIRFYFNTDDDNSRFLEMRESHKDLYSSDGLLSFFDKQFESLGLSVSVSDGFCKLEKTLKIAQMIFCKTDLFQKSIRGLMVSCQFSFNLSYACFLYDNDMRLNNNILSGPAYLSIATTSLGKSNQLYFTKPDNNNPAEALNLRLVTAISAFSAASASRVEQLEHPGVRLTMSGCLVIH